MSRLWWVGCLFALVWPGGLSGQMAAERSEIERLVDSVGVELDRGRVDDARSLARRALREAPGDADAWIAMGRVELATHAGRFRALKLFRRAADRRPDDPEPWYWIGRVGVELLGDDGEAIARPGLERALAIDPEYRDAWDLWTRLYRDGADRDRMVDLLRRHADRPTVRARIAGLWLEGGRCVKADSLLRQLEREDPDPRWPAWRAECAFLGGRDAEGHRFYARAVTRSARDREDALWAQVGSIATPEEESIYAALPPSERPSFYRAFWGRRDPNLHTPENERIPEHFRRRAEARQRYRLRHPLSLYHWEPDYRALTDFYALGPEIAPTGRNLPEQVDDRGLTFIRHGPPDRVEQVRLKLDEMDVEEWSYTSEPRLRLRWARGSQPPAPPVPEMLFRPVTADGARSVWLAMISDRSSLPADLEFDFWFARFAREEGDGVELVIVPDATVAAAAALWDGAGGELARGRATAGRPLRLTVPSGRFLLGLDAERGDSLGRYRGRIELPDYTAEGLAVSDLLIGHAPTSAPDSRDAAVRNALPSLAIASGAPFSVYLEVYGLAVRDGRSRYEVRYEFEREQGWLKRLLTGKAGTTLRFRREVEGAAGAPVLESLRLEPGDLAAGAYALQVHVRDLQGQRDIATRRVRLRVD